MYDYQGKSIVIVGLGATGLSCVDFFLHRDITPKVIDTRENPAGLAQLPDGVPCHMGSLREDWLLTADLIVCSPGIALTHAALQKASDAGVEIVGDIELFCREAKAPIIAITGSNGKSTVTTLVGEMAKRAGIKVGIGGNLGQPALTLLTAPCQLYVLELSSFQLETTYSLKAAAATVLNVTEDHMDRYPAGLEQYRQAKLKIYQHAEKCVINHDDILTYPNEPHHYDCISFGQRQGHYYLSQEAGELWLNNNNALLLNCAHMQLQGKHNFMNALAAMALADCVDIPRISQLETLRQFTGLPHRFQLVHYRNHVKWINDSKATNVGSTEAALMGLQCDGKVHLLLGGDGKAADFSPLLPYVTQPKIRLYCYGRDAAQLVALSPTTAHHYETLAHAMQAIAEHVEPGDTVLLSPACASLDQFKNYEQRGDCFTALALELG